MEDREIEEKTKISIIMNLGSIVSIGAVFDMMRSK